MANLIIVESPTKAKTISKFLGKDYKLESSFGHVRDLPKSKLGVDVDKNFKPQYLIPAKARKTVNNLKALVAKSDKIILASDEDREGEAIAWHLSEALGLKEAGKKVERIVFHEITKKAIEEALAHPRQVDMDKVDAQQARRVLDRIVGYKLSPFLWKKVARRLSAGRVQSVALRLIVEREEAIRQFKPQEYWSLLALLTIHKLTKKQSFEANLIKINNKALDKFGVKTKKDADKITADLKRASYKVVEIKRKETKRNPSPPFTTSTLQQASSSRLGFSAKKTMFLAQRLYESGHITYMRTDSVNLSSESTAVAKKWLADNLGDVYASQAPRSFKVKSKGAQEAHEAIRPTNPAADPDSINLSDDGQKRLYQMIWQRFMASQMPQAKIAATSIDILAMGGVEYQLRSSGQELVFDGYLKIWPQKFEKKELPNLEEKEELALEEIKAEQHFTDPPPRYNEASLVKILEEYGIGRPSTYAPIISIIQDRGYVEKEDRRFMPTSIGETVSGVLVKHFPRIVDVNFTAEMEADLDAVADGKKEWQKIIKEFYKPFMENLEKKYEEVKDKKVEKVEPEPTDEACEKCSEPMVIRTGRFGRFMACSGFPKCKNTKKIEGEKGSSNKELNSVGLKCEECGEGEIVQRFTRKGRRKFWGCSRYPKCEFATWTDPTKTKKGAS